MSHGVRCLAYEAAFAAGMAATDGRHELQVASRLSACSHISTMYPDADAEL